jgi:hypothetical protein
MTIQSGTRFGSLIALRRADQTDRRTLCVCTRCQHSIVVETSGLKDGAIASCDCRWPPAPSHLAIRDAARGWRRLWNGRR